MHGGMVFPSTGLPFKNDQGIVVPLPLQTLDISELKTAGFKLKRRGISLIPCPKTLLYHR